MSRRSSDTAVDETVARDETSRDLRQEISAVAGYPGYARYMCRSSVAQGPERL